LVATDHPIVNGTFSNQLVSTAASLSQTSLEQLLIQIRNAVDNNGKRIRLDAEEDRRWSRAASSRRKCCSSRPACRHR
jgi:hypothetical protein